VLITVDVKSWTEDLAVGSFGGVAGCAGSSKRSSGLCGTGPGSGCSDQRGGDRAQWYGSDPYLRVTLLPRVIGCF